MDESVVFTPSHCPLTYIPIHVVQPVRRGLLRAAGTRSCTRISRVPCKVIQHAVRLTEMPAGFRATSSGRFPFGFGRQTVSTIRQKFGDRFTERTGLSIRDPFNGSKRGFETLTETRGIVTHHLDPLPLGDLTGAEPDIPDLHEFRVQRIGVQALTAGDGPCRSTSDPCFRCGFASPRRQRCHPRSMRSWYGASSPVVE